MIKDWRIRQQQRARGEAMGTRTAMVVLAATIINKNTHANIDDVRATTPGARPRRTHAITRLEWTHAMPRLEWTHARTRLEWTHARTRLERMLQREEGVGGA